MKSKPQLLISDNFYKQAEKLCQEIPNVEWSGIGIYRVVGSINTLLKDIEDVSKEDFFIEVLDIIPMDMGTSGHTAYEFNPTVQQYMKKLCEERNMKPNEYYSARLLHLHSHVNMSVFFSGEDKEELEDNVFNHNGYLSIITNNKKEYAAKFVVGCNLGRKMEGIFTDIDGKVIPIIRNEEPKQTMLVFTPKILFENQSVNFDNTFLNAIKTIKEANKVTSSKGFHKGFDYKPQSSQRIYNYTTREWEDYDYEDNKSQIRVTNIQQPSNRIQVSGNLKQTITNKISTSEEVFLNFIRESLCDSFHEYKTPNNYSLSRILLDIHTYYRNKTKEGIDGFKDSLKLYIPIDYEQFVSIVSNKKDTEIYINDLKQVISLINGENYKKNFPIAVQMIESVCNNLIQETKKELCQK